MLTGMQLFDADDDDTMWELILKLEIVFPPSMMQCERQFLDLLLQREPTQRLGCVPEREEFIQYHEFFMNSAYKYDFDPIDWDDIKQRKVDPPYKPEFAVENLISEAGKGPNPCPEPKPNSKLSIKHKNVFTGFSYTNLNFE